MGQQQHPMDRDTVGAGLFAVARAVGAFLGSDAGNMGVLEHGLFFPSLGVEVMVVAHDGVDRHPVGALGLAEAARVPAVESAAGVPIAG